LLRLDGYADGFFFNVAIDEEIHGLRLDGKSGPEHALARRHRLTWKAGSHALRVRLRLAGDEIALSYGQAALVCLVSRGNRARAGVWKCQRGLEHIVHDPRALIFRKS